MTLPNILFVQVDQLTALATSVYGHPVVKTPNIQALADEGVVFRNAYCNSPLCGPSRMSMMTGRLPSNIGAYDNAVELPASIPTFAHYLRRLGYRTCLSGKMHFVGPDQLHGYEERLTTDIYPADFGWTPNWSEPEAKVRFQDMTNVIETGPCERSLQIDYDDETAFHAKRWLYDRARDEDKQPWMLTVSFTSPHDPYVARPEFWDLYQSEEIDLPSVGPRPDNDLDAHSRRLRSHYSIEEVTLTDDQIRRARHGYYASISYIEAKLGELRDVLARTGLAENTVVIFTADHGDAMGERGLWYKKSFFEWPLRVPLIMAGSGLSRLDVEAPVSLLDLLPTMVDIAEGDLNDIVACDGNSLWKAAKGADLPERMVAAEYLAEGVFEPVFMLRDDRYKFITSSGDLPVLYDLIDDPQELTDLAGQENHAQTVLRFQGLVDGNWDAAAIKKAVIADQRNRRAIMDAERVGRPPEWDYQPRVDASSQWVRRGAWTTVVEGKAFLPIKD